MHAPLGIMGSQDWARFCQHHISIAARGSESPRPLAVWNRRTTGSVSEEAVDEQPGPMPSKPTLLLHTRGEPPHSHRQTNHTQHLIVRHRLRLHLAATGPSTAHGTTRNARALTMHPPTYTERTGLHKIPYLTPKTIHTYSHTSSECRTPRPDQCSIRCTTH
jgi:hypothetical protein